jgi:hypothetical protein
MIFLGAVVSAPEAGIVGDQAVFGFSGTMDHWCSAVPHLP